MVEGAVGDGAEGNIGRVFPTELEAGLAEGVVAAGLRTGLVFGEADGKSRGGNEADHRLLRSFSGFGWGGNPQLRAGAAGGRHAGFPYGQAVKNGKNLKR